MDENGKIHSSKPKGKTGKGVVLGGVVGLLIGLPLGGAIIGGLIGHSRGGKNHAADDEQVDHSQVSVVTAVGLGAITHGAVRLHSL